MIDDVFLDLIDRRKIPGAVVQITRDGMTLYKKAYGDAHAYGFDGLPLTTPEKMTEDHVFDLGSLTKVFATTFGIMLLVDRKLISVEDEAAKYLTEFNHGDKKSITIRQLLTHTAGLTEWKPLYYHVKRREEVLPFISALPLRYPDAAEQGLAKYSDLGFMVLGYLIERISGQRLDVFLNENLYGKMALTRTGFTPLTRNIGPLVATSPGNPFEKRMIVDPAFGYPCDENFAEFKDWREYILKGEANDANAFHANGGVAGHAGLFSTASELTQLLEVLFSNGIFEGQKLFEKNTVDLFLGKKSNVVLGWSQVPGTAAANSLGLDPLPPFAFGHPGFTGTYALALPQKKLSVIILTNRQNQGVGINGKYFDLKPTYATVAKLAQSLS